ncbi:unnamed protein product [Ranitomeya imitator]|uniref:Uncharacterized protein n=1 Tax=Ranitomeya imitator TaxID=111125 RepID=A0ABN9LKI1_9NEOB|nr:unnamed protein product [Ranitomeya imitator]
MIQSLSHWQVWHGISVEAKHVKDIMSTLESYKLDSSPVKAAEHDFPAQDGEVWSLPVPVERRPSPGPRKRQSAQFSDNRVHNNRISVAGKGPTPPSSRNANNQKVKPARARERKDPLQKVKEKVVAKCQHMFKYYESLFFAGRVVLLNDMIHFAT